MDLLNFSSENSLAAGGVLGATFSAVGWWFHVRRLNRADKVDGAVSASLQYVLDAMRNDMKQARDERDAMRGRMDALELENNALRAQLKAVKANAEAVVAEAEAVRATARAARAEADAIRAAFERHGIACPSHPV